MSDDKPEGAKPLGPPMTYELHSALTRITDEALLRAYTAVGETLTNPNRLDWWATLAPGWGAEMRAELVRRRREHDALATTVDDAIRESNAATVKSYYLDEPVLRGHPLPTMPGEIRVPRSTLPGVVDDEHPYPEWTGPSEITVEKPDPPSPVDEDPEAG